MLGAIAIPLAPFLYRRHFLILVLLRPSQGVLLAGAVLARHGGIPLWELLAAALPLQVLVVWLYFLIGEAWQTEIDNDDELPFMMTRVLPPKRINRLRRALRKRGRQLVVLARFAVFPTGLLAATAGASDMEARRFFLADGAAFAVATALVVGTGDALGVAKHQAGVWVGVIGVAGLVALSGLLTWYVWHGVDD